MGEKDELLSYFKGSDKFYCRTIKVPNLFELMFLINYFPLQVMVINAPRLF